jgi:hypothetical protein
MAEPDSIMTGLKKLSGRIPIRSLYEKYAGLLSPLKVCVFLISIPLIVHFTYRILIVLTPVLYTVMAGISPVTPQDSIPVSASVKTAPIVKAAENRIKVLEKNLMKYNNMQAYLLVNTTRNEFTLFNRGKIVRSGQCSTGSFILLDAGEEKKWKFETPKGLFRIQGKTEYPVWKKPDWAFIEEGLPVPPTFSHLRYEYGVLGDYALSIGDGYLIHGTLYKRLLGMPVTHGCVRMNDEDLEAVFNTLFIGSKVYIF